MSTQNQSFDEDEELLRQVALSSLLKNKTITSANNAVFYRPSANSNLISIEPVTEYASKDTTDGAGENNCSTDSENEIIIAEGLSVSSSDCDEIIEELIVSDDDDENNNNDQKNEASEGEDAVSVASKDSFDEILNSIEEEISGVKKKPVTSTKNEALPKKRPNDKFTSKNEKPVGSVGSESKRRSRSPDYWKSSGRRRQEGNLANRRNKYATSWRDRERPRSRSQHLRSRSRSGSRNNHSFRNESRRQRSPQNFTERRWPSNKRRHRSSSRHNNKSPVFERRHRSRSPVNGLSERSSHKYYKGSTENERHSRSPSNYFRNKKDDPKQLVRPESSRKSNSPPSPRKRKLNEAGLDETSKATSPSRSKRESNQNSRPSSPNSHNKDDNVKYGKQLRQTEVNRSVSPSETRNLTAEERELFEKRKRKFQSSNLSVSSGKVQLKPTRDDISRESKKGTNVKKIRMTRDNMNILISDVVNDKLISDISQERYERKLKLSSRLGKKVEYEDETEANEKKKASRAEKNNAIEQNQSSVNPQSDKCSNSSSVADYPRSPELNKEDLRSKLEQKRASGGGRLFTFALRDTFDDSSTEKKSKRKVIHVNP